MKDILREFIEEVVLGEEKKRKEPIGLVSAKLRIDYINWIDDKKDLEAEIEFKHKRAIEKIERQLEEEYLYKLEQISEKKKNLWTSIRSELSIEEGTELNLDSRTGLVSKWIKE